VVVSWIGDTVFQFAGEGIAEMLKRLRFGRSTAKPLNRERQKILDRRANARANRRKSR
jgi:hypothetical protein